MTLQNHQQHIKTIGTMPYLIRHRRDYVFDMQILNKLSCEDLFNFANMLQADSKDKSIYIGETGKTIQANYKTAFSIVSTRNANPALKRDVTDTAAILKL